MYIYIYVYTYICTYVHTYIYTCIHICICICKHTHTAQARRRVRFNAATHIWIYVHVHIYIPVARVDDVFKGAQYCLYIISIHRCQRKPIYKIYDETCHGQDGHGPIHSSPSRLSRTYPFILVVLFFGGQNGANVNVNAHILGCRNGFYGTSPKWNRTVKWTPFHNWNGE